MSSAPFAGGCRWIVAALVIALALPLAAQTPKPAAAPVEKLVVIRADGTSNDLDVRQMQACVAETARAMNLGEQEMPQVIVVLMSPAAAEALGLERSEAHHNRNVLRDYYEVWLVDKAPLTDFAGAVEIILEKHFSRTYSEAERVAIVARVTKFASATVSVSNLQRSSPRKSSFNR